MNIVCWSAREQKWAAYRWPKQSPLFRLVGYYDTKPEALRAK
jgi:hypothetical protein